jgi:hypothetical protein
MRIALVFTLLLATACSGNKKPTNPSGFTGDLPQPEQLDDLDDMDAGMEQRLVTMYLDDGYPVSRDARGEPHDQGDAALFAGIGMGVLGCDAGRPIFAAVDATVRAHDGLIYRHPHLPPQTEIDNGPSSRDAVIGTMFGLVSRYNRCPEDREEISSLWALHRAFVEHLGDGRLYFDAGEDKQINGGLFWLWDRVANYLDVTGDAPSASKDRWGTDMVATAGGTAAAKAPCYPIHLNVLEQLTAAGIGQPLGSLPRAIWCQATRGTDIPLVEWYCERAPARAWLETYQVDGGYKYRHQHCKWEQPDGTDELGPGLDFLLLKRLAAREAL